jgi:demethylmenaquinone methyltransferase/2-methoxy-6-polyprenyl-1,4-benzoquinol methylase
VNGLPATPGTYGRLARWYERLAAGEWRATATGLELLAAQRGERLLEIGSGPGRALVEMAAAVAPAGHVDALDLSPQMIRLARRRLGQAGLSGVARAYQGDARRLPFADSSFDGVFMSFTLELFDSVDRATVLAECRRVLRPGGRLAIVSMSTSRRTPMRALYERLHERFPRQLDCRPIDLPRALREAGFVPAAERQLSLWGLPIAVVLAWPAADG